MFTPISLRNAKHSVLSEININSLYSKIYFAIECLDCEREICDCTFLFVIIYYIYYGCCTYYFHFLQAFLFGN